MASTNCPHCGGSVEQLPHLIGELVSCPYCTHLFQMPAAVNYSLVIPPDPPQLPSHVQPPPIFVVNPTAQHEPRLQASGWFTRSLASAGGIAVVVLGSMMLVCGGCYLYVASAVNAVQRDAKRETNEILEQTKTALRGHGVKGELSRDSAVTTFTLESDITHIADGSVRTEDGIKEYRVSFHVARFESGDVFTLKRVVVDGDTLYDESEQRKRQRELDEQLEAIRRGR